MIENFELIIHRQISKRLRNIPLKIKKQILSRINELRSTPRPHDSIQLDKNTFRLNIGEYRIIYRIEYDDKLVYVLRVFNRGEGYGRYLRNL